MNPGRRRHANARLDRRGTGIHRNFHQEWISEMAKALNRGLLPADHYAMAEQQAVGFGPDVLTLQDVLEEGPVVGPAL